MEKCCQRIRDKSKRKKAKWGQESFGFILRIGNRSSSNYYRVYQKHNGLQFELELKNQLVIKNMEKSTVAPRKDIGDLHAPVIIYGSTDYACTDIEEKS